MEIILALLLGLVVLPNASAEILGSVSGLNMGQADTRYVNSPVESEAVSLTNPSNVLWGDGSHLTGISSGTISGLTANKLVKATAANAIGNSSISDDGTSVAVAGANFSVGVSTFVVAGGLVGIGVATPLAGSPVAASGRQQGSGNQPAGPENRAGSALMRRGHAIQP